MLAPSHPLHSHYRASPRGHLFRTAPARDRRLLLARIDAGGGSFGPDEHELGAASDTPEGWAALGARAVEAHSGWALPDWIGESAGALLRAAEAASRALPSRELELALDAAAHQRRTASHGEWTSREWCEAAGLPSTSGT